MEIKDLGKRFSIVDAHAHIGIYPIFNVKLSADEIIKSLNKYNIKRAIIFTSDNESVEKAVKAHKELYGMVWANPKDSKTIKFLEKHLNDPKFVGVKLHPLLDGYLPTPEVLNEVMCLVKDAGWRVLAHCGHPPFTLPWSYEPLAEKFNNVPIVLGHMGHGHIVYINGSLEVASRRKNIYLEPSGMPMHTKILEAVKMLGAERVLWGSDVPFHHYAVELTKVMVADLSEKELELVLGRNALQLFALE
ncbi:MAG: amidohydrolase family protein [Nitrososphaerales archaeon]